MSSRRVGCEISDSCVRSDSIVGSLESIFAIVNLRIDFLCSVCQVGTSVSIDLYSSSRLSLHSNSALVMSSCGVGLRESSTVFLMVFRASIWYSGSLWIVGGHLKIPFPLVDSVMSKVIV